MAINARRAVSSVQAGFVQSVDLLADIRHGEHDPTLIGHFLKPCGYGSVLDLVRQPQEGVDMVAK
jgi:hypothetical protein